MDEEGDVLTRRSEWKQNNPQDQLKAVLMTAEGYVSNIRDGIYPGERLDNALERIQDLIGQAQELAKMVDGKWPDPEADARFAAGANRVRLGE